MVTEKSLSKASKLYHNIGKVVIRMFLSAISFAQEMCNISAVTGGVSWRARGSMNEGFPCTTVCDMHLEHPVQRACLQ